MVVIPPPANCPVGVLENKIFLETQHSMHSTDIREEKR